MIQLSIELENNHKPLIFKNLKEAYDDRTENCCGKL